MTEELLRRRALSHGDFNEMATLAEGLAELLATGSSWPRIPLPQRHAMRMMCLKLARISSGDYTEPDHWLDLEGYASRGGQAYDTKPEVSETRAKFAATREGLASAGLQEFEPTY